MTELDIKTALDTARDIVQDAHKEGRLQDLTARIVRKEVEQVLRLADGTLENEKYKNKIKEFVRDLAEELSTKETPVKSGDIQDETPVKKAHKTEKSRKDSKTKKADSKSSSKSDKPKSEKQSRAVYKSRDVIDDDEGDLQDVQEPNTGSKAEKKKSTSKAEKPSSSRRNTKSQGTVDAGDDEESDSEKAREAAGKAKTVKGTKSVSKLKEKKPAAPRKGSKSKETIVEDELDEIEQKAKPRASPKRAASSPEDTKPKAKKRKLNKEESAEAGSSNGQSHHGESDSEMSVLEDEPPKRKKKEKVVAKKPREKKVGKAKAVADLSPDEEQIKKLKSLIVACGVRKVWSKELSGLDTPGQQISHLRGILTGLGMTGRFSLEKAREIKAKRELAQELEDVQTFAQKHAVEKEGRVSRSNAKESDDHSDSEEENGEDEDTSARPGRRRQSAMKSIMAFLGDQSESD